MDMRVFLVLVSLLYVGLVRFIIRLKYIPVAAGKVVKSGWQVVRPWMGS